MHYSYVSAFFDLVKEKSEQTGFEMPQEIEAYIVFLLAAKVNNPTVVLQPSFAEKYLQLYDTPNTQEIKFFADHCLWFTSFAPVYGKKRGLPMDYYASLGISSYYAFGDLQKDDFFIKMGNWFYTLRDFIEMVLNTSPLLKEDLEYLATSGSRTAKNKLNNSLH